MPLEEDEAESQDDDDDDNELNEDEFVRLKDMVAREDKGTTVSGTEQDEAVGGTCTVGRVETSDT